MKLLAGVFWASWFFIEWCRVFHLGDPEVLVKMFWTHLVSAILCSALYFISWSWERATPSRTRIKPMPPKVRKDE